MILKCIWRYKGPRIVQKNPKNRKEQNRRTNSPFNLYFYLASLYNVKKNVSDYLLIGTSTFWEEFRFKHTIYSSVDIDTVDQTTDFFY